jgi:hypothetical protein
MLLRVLRKHFSPFLAFSLHKLLRFIERLKKPFALDEVARLARRHQVRHAPGSASGVGMDVIDG